MPVNPAYRGFFKAMDAIARGADPWSAYREHYLRPHQQVLQAYWRQCWDADDERIAEMVHDLRVRDYAALREMLAAADVEGMVEQALRRCGRLVELPPPQVDLLIGRFSPDAFLLQVGGGWHIGVGLERFSHLGSLPLFIAHEYGHYARRHLAAEAVTVGERVVAEGAAVCFARAAYPEVRLARHLHMSPRRLHEIQDLERELWQALAPHLEARWDESFAGVIAGARRWRGFPPRFGVVVGCSAVQHFTQALGRPPTDRAVLSAPAGEILAAKASPR